MNPWRACAVAAALLLGCARPDPFDDPEYARVCASLPIHTVEERTAAAMKGYEISNLYDCITRQSHDAVERQDADIARARAQRAAAAPAPAKLPPTLAEARAQFSTRVSVPGAGVPLPQPPAELFVRADYASDGRTLAAFVTPDPRDGAKHPAIVWITGGDSSSLDDFWTAGAADNDQSASAFRKAGVVMMFPTLRGGNRNEGGHQYFLGEVDDVIAAGNRVAKLAYVDPGQIYLGGHSTGGTLVLLAAETTSRFKAVFAFGAVAEIGRYPDSLVPVDFSALAREEAELRSPLHWLHGISTPAYLIEGRNPPGNLQELEALCADKSNPQVHCLSVGGQNHFSVLAPATRVIAARIIAAADGRRDFDLHAGDFDAGDVGARP